MYRSEQNNLEGELPNKTPLKNVDANKCDNPQSSDYNCDKPLINDIERRPELSRKEDDTIYNSLHAKKAGAINNIIFGAEGARPTEIAKKDIVVIKGKFISLYAAK